MIKKKKKKTVFNNISNFLNNEGVKYIYMLCDVPQWYRLAFFFQVHLKGWWGKKKKEIALYQVCKLQFSVNSDDNQ
jgi:hypothetical protein